MTSGTLFNLSETGFLIWKTGVIIPQKGLWGSTSHFTWCSENISFHTRVTHDRGELLRPLPSCPPTLHHGHPGNPDSTVWRQLSSPAPPSGWSEVPGNQKRAPGKSDWEDPQVPGNSPVQLGVVPGTAWPTPPRDTSGVCGPRQAAASRKLSQPQQVLEPLGPIFQPLLSTIIKAAFAF